MIASKSEQRRTSDVQKSVVIDDGINVLLL